MFEVNYLENKDRQTLSSLLESEHLCFNDIRNIGVFAFEVILNKVTVGYFGYELYGNYALFRSMVMVPRFRKKGNGSLVWNIAKERLKAEQVEKVYLLTNSSEQFFKKQGFEVVPRSSAPRDIASTTEFIEFCPSDSKCMTLNLIAL